MTFPLLIAAAPYREIRAQTDSLPPMNPLKLNGGLQTFAFATKVTNTLGHTAYTQFDYYLGKPVNGEIEVGKCRVL